MHTIIMLKKLFSAITPPHTFKKPTRSNEVSNSKCIYFKLTDGLHYDEHFCHLGWDGPDTWLVYVCFLLAVSGELLGVKCLYNLEPHCQDVNGLWDYSGSLVYIRLLLVRSIQWLEWNKINPEIERTPNLLSHGGGGVWCAVRRCIANTLTLLLKGE